MATSESATDVSAKDANRADGLTAIEGLVMEELIDAANDYTSLPVEHDDEPGEFRHHIHMLQGLLAHRVARRAFPKGWT